MLRYLAFGEYLSVAVPPLRPLGFSQASASSIGWTRLYILYVRAIHRILMLAHLEGVSDRELPFIY